MPRAVINPASAPPTDPPPRSDGVVGGADEVTFSGTWRGRWNVQMDGIQFNNQETSMSCEAYSVEMRLAQTGNSFTGTMQPLGGGMCRVDGVEARASTAGAPAPVEGQVDGNTISWAGAGCQYTAARAVEGDRIAGTGTCTDSQRPGSRAELTFTMTQIP